MGKLNHKNILTILAPLMTGGGGQGVVVRGWWPGRRSAIRRPPLRTTQGQIFLNTVINFCAGSFIVMINKIVRHLTPNNSLKTNMPMSISTILSLTS